MPRGLSLHIGLNSVDPDHYGGWSGPLNACVNDANDMADLALSRGFEARVMLGREATRRSVTEALVAGVRSLADGDLLLVTYSGHGSQMPDWNKDEEKDQEDETWCLFDGQLVDDQLWKIWLLAPSNTRIVVVSDSCHSGDVVRAVGGAHGARAALRPDGVRRMPPDVGARLYRADRAIYDPILLEPAADRSALAAGLLLMSACREDELAYDGTANGQFTSALLRAWRSGRFRGSYRRLLRRLTRFVATPQTPQLALHGPKSAALGRERPFTP